MVKNKQAGIGPENSRFQIKVTVNGPYIVSGGVPLAAQRIVLDANGECLEWKDTRRYPEKRIYSLCRCGKSKKLPFCDGTHLETHFDGTETAGHKAYLDLCKLYTGPALDLEDAEALCAHAEFCDRAGGIWKLIERSNDPEARRIAIEEGCNCPSGRLVVLDKEGKAIEPALEPSIGVVESPAGELLGPLWVRGGIPILSAKGEMYEVRNRVTLCGCGKSANKPFCDSSHRQKKS